MMTEKRKRIQAPFTRVRRANFCTDKNLHGSTWRLHGTGGTRRIFELLSVQVWDLKKAGQLFYLQGSIFRMGSCKYPNRAKFCSDREVRTWNLVMLCLVAWQKIKQIVTFCPYFVKFCLRKQHASLFLPD